MAERNPRIIDERRDEKENRIENWKEVDMEFDENTKEVVIKTRFNFKRKSKEDLILSLNSNERTLYTFTFHFPKLKEPLVIAKEPAEGLIIVEESEDNAVHGAEMEQKYTFEIPDLGEVITHVFEIKFQPKKEKFNVRFYVEIDGGEFKERCIRRDFRFRRPLLLKDITMVKLDHAKAEGESKWKPETFDIIDYST